MKKLLLSIVSVFMLFALSAQISENFSDYTVGGKIAQQAQAMGRNYWTTWNSLPGSNEDGVVGEIEGNKCGKFEWLGNGTVDQILLLGGKTAGTWELSLKIYVPANQCGYFNVIADFKGQQSKWAFQIYFNKDGTAPGVGTMDAGGADAASFVFNHDTWIPVRAVMNLDLDQATIYINENQIHSWTYTHGSFGPTQGGCPRVIDALNIYPPTAGKSTYYVDDIAFAPVGEETFPILDITPKTISELIVPGSTITKTITIENTGTSIGDYLSWINFGKGEDGQNQNLTLTYSEDYGEGIGFSNLTEPTWVQIASKFPVSYFCDKIGTYITKLSYFVPSDLGSDPLIFRIYGPQTDNSGPGELLVETSLSSYNVDMWNEVTLPEPFLLDGREIWLSVQFTHLVGAYPIACDGKAPPIGINWIRYANYSWSDWGEDWGDFMIKGLLEGKTTPACWVSLTGNTYGSVPMSSYKTFNVVLSAEGLEVGTYETTIIIQTNDPENQLLTIPCTLVVNSSSVMSVNPKLIDEIIDKEDEVVTIEITISNSGNISGNYNILDVGVDWLTLSGDNAGSVESNGSKTFKVILNAEGLENERYETEIEIEISDENNNKIIIPCALTVDILGVGEYNVKTLVFPNPATNSVIVKSTQNINSVQIINFVGQTVYSTNVNKDQTTINTSNLNGGIYFIRVNTEAGVQSVKLIIK